jgi:hypothetical protein
MNVEEIFELIIDALDPLRLDVQTEYGRRVYLAHQAARLGLGLNSGTGERVQELRAELGL